MTACGSSLASDYSLSLVVAEITASVILISNIFSVHVNRGRGSAVQFVMYTSGIVNDVVFSHNGTNGPESKTRLCFVRCTRWRHRGRSCCLRLQTCLYLKFLSKTLAVTVAALIWIYQ